MYQERKKLFDMNKKDFDKFCDCNIDFEGWCKKTCKLHGTEICKVVNKSHNDNINLSKLCDELNNLKDLELTYIDRYKN